MYEPTIAWAFLVGSDGIVDIVFPSNGAQDFSLEDLHGFIGGWLERVCLPRGHVLLVNEDGIRLELPYNLLASHLASQPIVGPALLFVPEQWRRQCHDDGE